MEWLLYIGFLAVIVAMSVELYRRDATKPYDWWFKGKKGPKL